MNIKSFHIDGFGLFSNVNVEDISPTLTIFLGNNEAGKSTCLNFFRTMLTGYPAAQSKELQFKPLYQGEAGGTLTLDTKQYGLIKLTRRPSSKGGALSLYDADGKPMEPNLLEHLMGGITRDVYNNIFGFSLAELQTFDSLNSDNVKHALYGASFGMGLRSPGQIFKEMDEKMGKIFKPKGNTPKLNQYQPELENIRQKIQELIEENEQFDEIASALTQSKSDFEQAKTARNAKQAEYLQLERKTNVWNQWKEWRSYKLRLERLEPISADFPQDGSSRWQMASNNLENMGRQLIIENEKKKRIAQEISDIDIESSLLSAIPEINSLAESKSSFRNSLLNLPTQEDALTRAQEELTRLLTALGPDWTCQRIIETDRSLFAKDRIERQAEEMSTSKLSYNIALDAVNKSERILDKAKDELKVHEDTLEKLPKASLTLSNSERELLRQSIERITEIMQDQPELEQNAKLAKSNLDRVCETLHIDSAETHKIIKILSDNQNIALNIASDFKISTDEDSKIQEDISQIKNEENVLKARIDKIDKQLKDKRILSRDELNERTGAIRTLRHFNSSFTHKQEQIDDLKDRKQALIPPVTMKNWWLIGFGSVFSLIGCFVLLLNLPMPLNLLGFLDEIAMVQSLKTPLSTWFCIPLILAGISCLAGGLPRTGHEMQRHNDMVSQLDHKINAHEEELEAFNTQILSLCEIAKINDPDPISLDATEMLLQNERELSITQEKLRQDILDLQEEHNLCKNKIKILMHSQGETNATVQKIRHDWHDLMTGCGLEHIPDANSAEIFFERIESAKSHSETYLALDLKIADLEEQLIQSKNALFTLEPIADIVFPDDQLDVILDAIKTVIESCNSTDLILIEHNKTYTLIESAKTNYERVLAQYEEDSLTTEFAKKRTQISQDQWQENLQTLGITSDLSPQTIRDALEKMEQCLNVQAEQDRIQNVIQNTKQEINTFIGQLQAILRRLNYDDIPDSPDEMDWISILDSLSDSASLMKEQAQSQKNLNAKLQEQQYTLDNAKVAAQGAKYKVHNLLQMAEASNAEEFLRKANVKKEKDDYQKHLDLLEDSLKLVAKEVPLDEFMRSFENMDEYEIRQYAENIQSEIDQQEEKEQELAAEIASLSARYASLQSAEQLSELRLQEASIEENMHIAALEWSKYAIARQLLKNAKLHFEKERQPEIIKKASDIYNKITDSAWINIIASLEDSSLEVMSSSPEKNSKPILPTHLSRGAQEQLYLALRLAYIRNHSSHATPLPVIMDDILVNFDAGRARHTAKAFLELTKTEQKNQILFFTCHPYMADMLQDIIPDSNRLIIENGKILQSTAV